MLRHWWQQSGMWRLALALVVFMTSLYFSYRDLGQANNLAGLRIAHHTHTLFKTYEDVERLMRSLRHYAMNDPVYDVGLESVQLDYELLVSRLPVFYHGEANRELAESAEVRAAVDSLAIMLDSIEPLIANLRPDRYDPAYAHIQSLLRTPRVRFLDLTKQFMMNAQVRNDQILKHLAHTRSDWVIAAPAVSGVTLLLLFFLQLRQSRALAKTLEAESHKLAHQAAHDPLTALPNRALLQERLGQAIRRSRRAGGRFAVMFLDLDRFKAVNDSLGHAAGDELLKTVAERLGACVREGDTVARISGDEFVLLIENIGDDNTVLDAVANRVAGQLRTPFLLAGQELLVTGSIGVSLYPEHGEEAELLLLNADVAMYSSKANGRNSIHAYQAEMNVGSVARLELNRDLHFALERGQLVLHYQPLVRLATGQIFGVEALLRWQHPSRGLLGPDEFIPLAEENGLILPIGEWVIQAACAQAIAWHQQGLPLLKMAVNLSALQFQQAELAQRVGATLEASGFPAELLELELTETQLMRNVDLAIAATQALRELGVGLAVDDFGTGYCSLIYLQRFPVSKLKLDRSFVQDALSKPRSAAIARSVISLGRSLGLEVLAEGIETPEQLVFLRAHGCDYGQGYLFSRPLAAAQIARLIRANLAAESEDNEMRPIGPGALLLGA
ncbi:EAL domain-containing protein [Pseudomonas sp. LPB0260]|uniref:putative bifunctional diguanylate cyclase/phosphodiesterase n=1 Tax=Pseudomonas sp. LPB0260 TaxID=2614442 RepID=UPI0015C266ED|nr:EAL domain-containing protein [Pseudomonas sp. LPB0260]QLC72945.1 EAL domain-containing protein [Pseudomonas sp. LPB0260]QLC75719.1 EAL domain-containing protein [Pseudomonas sp. LPB0260]